MAAKQSFFYGWAGLSPDSATGQLVWQELTPKEFGEYDIDMNVTHASIDGSDLHVLRGGWGPPEYPLVAGHEFVGHVLKVGSRVRNVSVGDRVGVGGQVGSCLFCSNCVQDSEQHCHNAVRTYGGVDSTNVKTQGGFATHWRGDSRFVTKIPEEIPLDEAAPLFCAGVTMYSALKHNGTGLGSRVGVIGIGGTGHLGLLFAKALGASQVVAISRTSAKRTDAFRLGATDFIATDEGSSWKTKFSNSLDVIVNSASGSDSKLGAYLDLLGDGGTFVQTGAPEELMPNWSATSLILKRCKIVGSYLGSRRDVRNMLELAANNGIHPWVEKRPMRDINRALREFPDARYRIVLCN